MSGPAEPGIRSVAAVWWGAVRYHYAPSSFLPAMVGGTAAWALTGSFLPGLYLLTVACVTLNHLALNMTDDYFDYRNAVDRPDTERVNPYTGGSGALTSGRLSPGRMLAVVIVLYALTLAGVVYAAVLRGWPVLAFGIAGLFSSVFYTAGPLRYAYRGFGEVSQLVNFSLVLGLGSYFVQAGRIDLEPALLVLPLGLMMFSMIVANEIPDLEEDGKAGKRNLVVRLGARRSLWLYACGMGGAYLLLAVGAASGALAVTALAPLATIPLFGKALAVFRGTLDDPKGMARANLRTIQVHNLTGILLAGSCLVHGLLQGRSLFPFAVQTLLLIGFYAPALPAVFPLRVPGPETPKRSL